MRIGAPIERDKRVAQAAATSYASAMLRLRTIAAVGTLVALASCGKMASLEPAPGQPLPPKPMMAQSTPTPDDLLDPPFYGDPQRVDELMKRSAPRKSDPFNLPPPGGQAPTLPVQETSPNQMTNQAGPVTPQ